MKLRHSFIFFAILLGHTISAQSHDHNDDHDDVHHKNEIGIANSPVYFINEKEFAYSLHFHYVRSIKETKFGLGLGYERIFDEHKHNTIGIIGSYRLNDAFALNISPGITFEGEENTEINFALHFESSYEFEFHNFHIGPVIELAYDPEDYHISIGLHVGYGF